MDCILLESDFLAHDSECHPIALKAGDIIAHGHTHIPVAEYQDEIFIFNPSSVTFPRDGHAASYGVYENKTFKVISLEGDVIVSGEL